MTEANLADKLRRRLPCDCFAEMVLKAIWEGREAEEVLEEQLILIGLARTPDTQNTHFESLSPIL